MNRRIALLLGAGAFASHNRHAVSQVLQPPEALRLEGYSAFPTIRTGFGPGTIIQRTLEGGVQRARVFYEFKDLEVQPEVAVLSTEEQIPSVSESSRATIAGVLDLVLSVAGLRPKVDASFSSGSTVTLKFGRGYRESIKGADIQRIIRTAVKKGLVFPGRYALITSTISFLEIEAQLTGDLAVKLEGDIAAAKHRLHGKGEIRRERGAVLVPQAFTSPMRTFYAWDDIRPKAGAIVGPDDIEFDTIKGLTDLPIEAILR